MAPTLAMSLRFSPICNYKGRLTHSCWRHMYVQRRCCIAAPLKHSWLRGGDCKRGAEGQSGRRYSLCLAVAQQTPVQHVQVEDTLARIASLVQWTTGNGADAPLVEASLTGTAPTLRTAFVATADIDEMEAILQIPGDLCITRLDAGAHEVVGTLAEERSELVQLGLWLMAERSKGAASKWHTMLSTFPQATHSPVLWDAEERSRLLRGSPTLPDADAREAALRTEWQSLAAAVAGDPTRYSPDAFNERAFLEAMSVVFAYSAFLYNAQCFALLPLATLVRRTGNENGAVLEYNLDLGCVTLTATRPYRQGQEVVLRDGRPNGELLLATGVVEDNNMADCLTMSVELVPADRMYSMKKQILESVGFEPRQEFPIYEDRMPLQLLAYLRLARIADPAQLAKVTFEDDVIITPANEYEVLQLLLGDCKDRLAAYNGDMEADVKALQNPNLSVRERLARRLCLAEKRIVQGTLDSVRRRLAPIRGIPTKGGNLSDPNSDLKEIFDTFESLPSAPIKLAQGLMSWARGEQDPDWKPKGKKGPRQ